MFLETPNIRTIARMLVPSTKADTIWARLLESSRFILTSMLELRELVNTFLLIGLRYHTFTFMSSKEVTKVKVYVTLGERCLEHAIANFQ